MGSIAIDKQVLVYVNLARRRASLDELSWSDALYELAQIRSRELQSHYSHTRPDGNPFWTVSTAKLAKAENIALGQSSAKSVVDAWMRSKGHRENILRPESRLMAASFLRGRWVQLFG